MLPLIYHNLGCVGLHALVRHGFEIPVAVTHRDSSSENVWFDSVANACSEYGIETVFSEDLSDDDLLNLGRRVAPDVILSVYFRRLISEDMIAVPRLGAVNIHGSLLPQYRGRVPVNWQLIHGETRGGVSLHYMVRKPDAGDIIAQQPVPIDLHDTALTVYEKLQDATERMLNEELPRIEQWKERSYPQNHEKASVFFGRKPEDGRIDWTDSSMSIYNLVRAVTRPYPGAFSDTEKARIFFWSVALKEPHNAELCAPGTVTVENESAFIRTGDGWLQILDCTSKFQGQSETAITPRNLQDVGRNFNSKSQVDK